MVSTPCINICTLDPASRLCTGCGRSLEEIARWGTMSEPQRLDIMRGLDACLRNAGLNSKPKQETQP
jgi:hypothetical protein